MTARFRGTSVRLYCCTINFNLNLNLNPLILILLLEEAVNAKNSLKDYQNIQHKLNLKINSLNNQINSQQKILNELFENSNNGTNNCQIQSKFFFIEDLNLLEIIRKAKAGRGRGEIDQYRDSEDILESNVSNNNAFPYRNPNNSDNN